MHRVEDSDQYREKGKTPHEVKPFEKINMNLQSFQKIRSLMQKEFPSLHKLQEQAYQKQNPFRLK